MDESLSLRLFNEKADKLLKTRFVCFIKETGKLSATISSNDEGATVTRVLPDQDAIDAFVLTFRFFIQDNEKSSFRQISKSFEKMPISSELKKELLDWRDALNKYLDNKVNITVFGYTPTRREVLDIFIYGGLAHANPQKKVIYDSWKKDDFTYAFLEVHFVSILEVVLRAICGVGNVTKRALTEL